MKNKELNNLKQKLEKQEKEIKALQETQQKIKDGEEKLQNKLIKLEDKVNKVNMVEKHAYTTTNEDTTKNLRKTAQISANQDDSRKLYDEWQKSQEENKKLRQKIEQIEVFQKQLMTLVLELEENMNKQELHYQEILKYGNELGILQI